MFPIEKISKSEQETKLFAVQIAAILKAGDLVLLSGDLGSGKTFFCREIIKYFCGDDIIVNSPSFNLLQIYQANDFSIFHYDLYRLKNSSELSELAFEEALSGNLCLIEWPEIALSYLPFPRFHINFSYQKDNLKIIIKKL